VGKHIERLREWREGSGTRATAVRCRGGHCFFPNFVADPDLSLGSFVKPSWRTVSEHTCGDRLWLRGRTALHRFRVYRWSDPKQILKPMTTPASSVYYLARPSERRSRPCGEPECPSSRYAIERHVSRRINLRLSLCAVDDVTRTKTAFMGVPPHASPELAESRWMARPEASDNFLGVLRTADRRKRAFKGGAGSVRNATSTTTPPTVEPSPEDLEVSRLVAQMS
jgi:hypothetical protein